MSKNVATLYYKGKQTIAKTLTETIAFYRGVDWISLIDSLDYLELELDIFIIYALHIHH